MSPCEREVENIWKKIEEIAADFIKKASVLEGVGLRLKVTKSLYINLMPSA